MKQVEVSSIDGFEVGDFVLAMTKSPSYARIIKITAQEVEENDHYAKYGRYKPGDTMSTWITVERVLNLDMSESKRYKSRVWSGELKKMDKDFIKEMFRKLNDALAKNRMLKEQEEI